MLDFAGLRAMVLGSARKDTFQPGEIERYTEAWEHPGSLTAMLNYYRALRERNDDQPGPSSRIAAPTLVIWGEHDSFLEQHVARAALDLCDSGRLLIIPDATHWLHLEEPARVNAEIIRFLDGTGMTDTNSSKKKEMQTEVQSGNDLHSVVKTGP